MSQLNLKKKKLLKGEYSKRQGPKSSSRMQRELKGVKEEVRQYR